MCDQNRTVQQAFLEIGQAAHVELEWLGQGELRASACCVFEAIADITSTDNASRNYSQDAKLDLAPVSGVLHRMVCPARTSRQADFLPRDKHLTDGVALRRPARLRATLRFWWRNGLRRRK